MNIEDIKEEQKKKLEEISDAGRKTLNLFKNNKNREPAEVVVQDVMRIKKGERVLIIANPATAQIAQDLYTASVDSGASVTLMYQPDKISFDNANPEVIAAIKTNPDVCFSISNIKLGKDPEGAANPYTTDDGQTYTSAFDYLLDGKKTMRAAWTPGITEDMMNRTACIDYAELGQRCKELETEFKNAVSVHVTAPAGTDITISVENRKLMFDDGDFFNMCNQAVLKARKMFDPNTYLERIGFDDIK